MLLSLQHDQAFRISKPRWKVKKFSRSRFAEVSLCAGVSANVTVIFIPAFSQPTAILPVLLCASVLTFTILASVRLNSSNKKFKKWNAFWHFTLPEYEKRSKHAQSVSDTVYQSSTDLFVCSFPLLLWDDWMGRFCFCVVTSARL